MVAFGSIKTAFPAFDCNSAMPSAMGTTSTSGLKPREYSRGHRLGVPTGPYAVADQSHIKYFSTSSNVDSFAVSLRRCPRSLPYPHSTRARHYEGEPNSRRWRTVPCKRRKSPRRISHPHPSILPSDTSIPTTGRSPPVNVSFESTSIEFLPTQIWSGLGQPHFFDELERRRATSASAVRTEVGSSAKS